MTEADLLAQILDALTALCAELAIPTDGLGADTVLFGDGSLIDSMALVGLIIQVEEHVAQATGLEIQVIDDDTVIADGQTPLRTPATLAAFVAARVQAAAVAHA